jgi:hypothetical protein
MRITSVRLAPDRLEEVTAAYEQQVIPLLRQQPGYRGAVLDVNRDTGEAWGISYWESLEALNANEHESTRRRPDAAASVNASVVDVERYEVVIFDRPPGVTGARVARLPASTRRTPSQRGWTLRSPHCGSGPR